MQIAEAAADSAVRALEAAKNIDPKGLGVDQQEQLHFIRTTAVAMRELAASRRTAGAPIDWARLQQLLDALASQLLETSWSPNQRVETAFTQNAQAILTTASPLGSLARVPTAHDMQERFDEAVRIGDVTTSRLEARQLPLVETMAATDDWLEHLSDRMRTCRRAEFQRIRVARKSIAETDARLTERRQHLEALIDTLTNAESVGIFERVATEQGNAEERLWNRGVAVLYVGAFISILPILSHYANASAGWGHHLSGASFVTAHAAPALAAATIAGVILARARSRDRERIRAARLGVALRMMFAHADQITDDTRRATFIHDTGHIAIETYVASHDSESRAGRGLLPGT